MLKFLLKLFTVSFLFCLPSLNAQTTFGFGCLGFVGGFGGYSYQKFQPTGLNDYIVAFNDNNIDSLQAPMSSFDGASGYRVGINFFRANFTGFIITSKGFYQSLIESKETRINSSLGITNTNYELKLNSWGVGFDLGTSISNAVSWKVIEATLLFNKATFVNTNNFPGSITDVKEYNSESELGYSIGTGFILQLVDEYITVEGLAAYTVFSIDELSMDNGEKLTISETSNQPMKNFIESGGFNAVIQLNVGFPL